MTSTIHNTSRVIQTCGPEVVRDFRVPAGTTVWEVMARCNPVALEWQAPTICLHRGEPLLREAWKTKVLEPDEVLLFSELPMGGGGGGSNPLQAVFTVAIVVASIYTAGVVGAATWGGPTMGALAGAGVSLAGGIISSLMFGKTPSGQMSALDAASSSPTYSINGSSNQARLYQPEPEGFGRIRVVYDLVNHQWREYVDNEEYMCQVYGAGRGLYEHHSFWFSDVKFWEDGHVIDSAFSKDLGPEYTNTIAAEVAQGEVSAAFAATEPGEAARALSVVVAFPDGLSTYWLRSSIDAEGGYNTQWLNAEATATADIEYRELNLAGDPVGDWAVLHTLSETRSQNAGFTVEATVAAPHYAAWQIRLRNTSDIPEQSSGAPSWRPNNPVYINNRRRMVLQSVSSTAVGVAVEIVEPGETVSLFLDNVTVSANVAGQTLLAPNEDGHEWLGPYTTNLPGTTVQKLYYNFMFQGGLGRYDDRGNFESLSVNIRIEIRSLDDAGNPLGEWVEALSRTYSGRTLTAQRYTEIIDVDEGRYETRVIRTTNTDKEKHVDTILWTGLTGIIPGLMTYPQTVVAVKIRATNLSQSAASNFAGIQTRKLPVYDPDSGQWSEPQPTRSFAAAVAAVCKASYGGDLADSHIDLDTLFGPVQQHLDAWGWTFDAWIDGAYTMWELIVQMCDPFRVVPRQAGSVLSFAVDKAGREVRHEFTPYDIVRGSFVPTWNTWEEGSPDDVLVSYLDEDADYLQRDVRAVLPESESLTPTSVSYLGIVNRKQAHAIGVFKAACNRWRRLGCEFETEAVSRLLNIGDVITVNHPRFRDTVFGEITGWDEPALGVTLNASVTPMAGVAPYLSLTRPDGSVWGPVKLAALTGGEAVFDAADYALLLGQGFGAPFAWMSPGRDRAPTRWTLQEGRTHKRRYIVTGIAPQSAWRSRITCINDDDRVDGYDIPVPIWEYGQNAPAVQTPTRPRTCGPPCETAC